MNVFNSVKEMNRLRKEINRLLSKGMPNIYSKFPFERNWRSQNFDFLGLKSLSPGQILGSSKLRRYHWILKLKNQRSGSKTVCGFYYFIFWKELWPSTVKDSMHFPEQKHKL